MGEDVGSQLPVAAHGSLERRPFASTSSSAPSTGDDNDTTEPLKAAHLDASLPTELVYSLVLNWRGSKQQVTVVESDTIGDLKAVLFSLTNVPPERQKIVGLAKGKLPGDHEEVVKLGLGPGAPSKAKEFMMIGTPEGEEARVAGPSEKDDGDIDYAADATKMKAFMAVQSVRNRRKLKEHAEKLEMNIIRPPRPDKMLLVLDLDGCILDTGSWKLPELATELFARPYLHDMLAAISPFYDVIIWSQTAWVWLERKIIELEMIGPTARGNYHIVSCLDKTCMFSVYSEKEGKAWSHQVKALGIIWANMPQYVPEKTVHLDDLSRNFAMNPKNGIKCHAYKDALTRDNIDKDKELLYVARYLLQLVNVADVTQLDHSKFRKSKLALPEGLSDPLDRLKRQ
ncbi:hypothetical protein BMF94_5769 [Rhodotorula taiwanensis]|uniref:Nuclear proteasome inhibitor UBLCP1 n=1 Tax=Rhodotorula taiwanensis TaxID=741276 RepID=A0A2S5B3X8_9BASI|nr:hypothetical protein BMF94_5769 [Rhodotorula taiwanensis]